jgi:hypothetical protein
MPPLLPTTTLLKAAQQPILKRKNREALNLYREIIRTSRSFYWADPKTGQEWTAVLQKSARKEFEAARYETVSVLFTCLFALLRRGFILKFRIH